MDDKVKTLLQCSPRYKSFTLLDVPVSFNELFKNVNIDLVQLHSIQVIRDMGIVGFCGSCKWENNCLESLDGDSYCATMSVCGYAWFENKEEDGNKCIDILVHEW